MRLSLALPTALILAGAVQANDDFDNGTNPSGWSFNVNTPDVIEMSGGNPSGWLHNPFVASFAPIVHNDPSIVSPFNGDFRAAGVSRISVDAITNSVNFGNTGFEFSILLRDTKGTAMVDDDDYAYYVGPETPQPGNGWKSFSFDIPSQSGDAVPTGWKGGWVGDGENFRPGVEWSDVIANVDQVEFWWLNPSFFAIIQDWDVGIDNVNIDVAQPVGTNYCGPAVANSSGGPASMSAIGSDAVADNNLVLHAEGMPTNQFGYFVASLTQGFVPNPGGSQGNLCILGNMARFNSQIANSGAGGSISALIDINAIPLGTGPVGIAPGETWNFQAWFRDLNPTTTSNFTDGIAITFQ